MEREYPSHEPRRDCRLCPRLADFIAEWLGSEFRHVFGAQKRQEHAVMLSKVSDVELHTYLRRL